MVNIDLGLLKKNKEFKHLSLLQGFNLADPPVKINDNLHLTNNVILDNGDIIDEKIFIKFFGLVDNKEGSVKNEKKKTHKNKQVKRMKKDTKKEKIKFKNSL